MWYFAWILGVTMAVLLAIVSTMMCDVRAGRRQTEENKEEKP